MRMFLENYNKATILKNVAGVRKSKGWQTSSKILKETYCDLCDKIKQCIKDDVLYVCNECNIKYPK